MDGGQSELTNSLLIEEFGDFSDIETTQNVSMLEQEMNVGDNFVFARKRHMLKSSEVKLIEELEAATQGPDSDNLEAIETIR